MSKKLKIGVIFGGCSVEHEVSLVSAESVMKALDKKKYQVIPIGITKRGEWVIANAKTKNEKLLKLFKLGKIRKGTRLPPKILTKVDVIFPILHGTYGEDGKIQGLLEMLGVPYVGAGVLGSAIGMDKVIQKQLCEYAGLPVVKYMWFSKEEWMKSSNLKSQNSKLVMGGADSSRLKDQQFNIVRHIEKILGYPCFIKPASLGSSVGITKAHNRKELIFGINLAVKYDDKILIEEACPNAREIECSVLGNYEPIASLPGEVIPSGEFYDYDAKYVDGKSKTVAPVYLPKRLISKIQKLACQVFKITNCLGLARVDFLLDDKNQKVYINEINTIPGFTSISMYPKLWQASGLAYGDLLDTLINLALQRFKEKKKLYLSYKPKKKWYR